ncbi:hypothetical protein Lal_00018210 [Lupinus albus]|nr:hypothetical protein Lal_00018210 [Lupinus albus]
MATNNNKTQPNPDDDATVKSSPTPALASDSGNDSSLSDANKKIRRAERFGITLQLSEKEKRNSRAERFGTTSLTKKGSETSKAEELKRKARAKRFGVPGPTTTADEEAKKKARLARFSSASKAVADPSEEDKRKARALRFSDPLSGSLSQVNGEGSIEPAKLEEEIEWKLAFFVVGNFLRLKLRKIRRFELGLLLHLQLSSQSPISISYQVSRKYSEMEEKRNQQESNAAALSAGGEPIIVIEGVPAIIASSSTISPDDASSTDPAIVIDGVPAIIASSSTISPDDASSTDPAIVIDGVPAIIASNSTISPDDTSSADPAIVIDGVPAIIASNSTISPDDASSMDPAIVIDGVPAIIANNDNIPPGDASNAESAIVINEVADMIHGNKNLPCSEASSAAEMHGPSGLGKWLVGRKVRKWFEGRYCAGEVTKFEKWYRVLYEDGDSEDLDWLELEELLVPSEGKVPLKKLAKRVIKENKKSARNSVNNIDCSENPQIKMSTNGKYTILPYREKLHFKN